MGLTDTLVAKCRRLEEENADLREQVRVLREAVEASPGRFFGLGLSPQQRRILAIIVDTPGTPRESIRDRLYWNDPDGGPLGNVIQAQISKIRKRLGLKPNDIKAVSGCYTLSPTLRAKLKQLETSEP